MLHRIEKMLFNFLWEKNPLVKREICYLPKEMGGLDMIDISTMLKVKRVKFLLRILEGNQNDDWKVIPLKNLKSFDKSFDIEHFLLKVYDSSILIHSSEIPHFYKQCILSFQEFSRNCDIFATMDKIIWYNDEIKFNGSPIGFKHWAKAGLKTLSQILKPEGRLDIDKIKEVLHGNPGTIFEMSKINRCINSTLNRNNVYHGKTKVDELSLDEILDIEIPLNEVGKKKKLRLLSNKEIYDIFMKKKES